MGRLVFGGVASLALLGFFAWTMVSTFILRPNEPFDGYCELWLKSPEAQWLKLSGCVLDVDRLVLESEGGDFESFANRRQGLSTKLYETPPTWTAAWAPVRTAGGANVIKAAYRLASPELMKWINSVEQADEARREKLLADPVQLRRVTTPGVIMGHAEKPPHEGLRKAWGAAASAGLLIVLPGTPPPPEVPVPGLLAGLLGLMIAAWVLRTSTQSPRLDEPTPEQLASTMNTSDVKLELGALEELRREERRRKD